MRRSGRIKRKSVPTPESTEKRSNRSPDSANSTARSLSPFELLPQELHWKIYEYVPSAVLHLRQSSKTLKSYVDAFAMQPSTITFVHLLDLRCNEICVEISVFVPAFAVNLFELRCKLRNDESARRLEREDFILERKKYALRFRYAEGGDILEYLKGCMGRKIECLSICSYSSKKEVDAVREITDSLQFKRIALLATTLAAYEINALLSLIASGQADTAWLTVSAFNTPNPVDILHRLSALVRSLHLDCIAPKQKNELPHMMGIRDAEWAPIILEMFERRLERLQIESEDFP